MPHRGFSISSCFKNVFFQSDARSAQESEPLSETCLTEPKKRHPNKINDCNIPFASSSSSEEMSKAVKALYKPHDEEQIFGEYIASEMRQLKNPANKIKLKRVINEAIMKIADEDAAEP